MKPLIAIVAFFCLNLACSFTGYSQVQRVMEEELDLSLLKWHYAKYPKSTEVEWISIQLSEQKTIYKASFNFNGNKVMTMYNEQGKLISEKMQYEKNLPVSLIHYLDDMYAKYKVSSFERSTNFQTDEVSYTMKLKSKEKGDETIVFDKNLIPFDSYNIAGGTE